MKYYDCIIIGDDIYALTIALFLTRKMRNVLLINQPSPYKENTEEVTVEFDQVKHVFKYRSEHILTGLDSQGLTYAFLDDIGLENALDYEPLYKDYIVDKLGTNKTRLNQFEDFKIYLMRYYPKQIKQIRYFFTDLENHYKNYNEQYLSLLHNDDYTLTSLMVEWGDYSLYDLLMQYFTDETIINEFKTNNFINGLNLEKVSAYNFFSNYFMGLKSGFYFLKTPVESFRKILLEKIKQSAKHSIIDTKITNIVCNGKRVNYMEDKQGNKYSGKYYFVSDQPLEFYNDYFADLNMHVKKLKSYYPYLEDESVKRTMFLVFDKKPSYYDINELIYYYNDNDQDKERIIKIFNYTLRDLPESKYGKICIDFTYDKLKGYSEENILDKLFLAFPKLRKTKVSISYGQEIPYLAMLREEKLRKKTSINDLIDYESLNHLNVYDNLYIGGSFIRPESSIYGKIHQSIVTADKIEDNLYFKDEAEDHYYSNDEVMMMLRQNFDNSFFGNREIHINFHIGKSFYFFRIRGRNIVLHSGKYASPDLSIYTSNDQLIDLVYKKRPYKEILESGFFRSSGDKDNLKAFLKAFNLDDRSDFNPRSLVKPPFKNFGIIVLNLLLFIVSASAILVNYFNGLYIFASTLFLILAISSIKLKFIGKINIYELLLICMYLILLLLSIFLPSINQIKNDNIVLVPITVLVFISVIINRPLAREYLEYSHTKEFSHTKLFLSIVNGLSFIWGFIFLTIILGPFFTGERYVSVLYNFVFLGLLLSYYYPSIYVKTSIKRS